MLRNPYSKCVSLPILMAVGASILFTGLLPSYAKASSPAGLSFQREVGNYGLKKTNLHMGYAGPKVGTTNHVNIVFYMVKPYKEYLNVHHTRYQVGEKTCFYDWDSKTRKVIFDQCFDPWQVATVGAAAASGAIIAAAIEAGWNAIIGVPVLVAVLA